MATRPRLVTPAFAYLCLSTFLVYLSFYLLLPVLPVYAIRQGIQESAVGLIIGVFALTAMVLKPWVGWALDWRGRRRLLVTGASLFAVASGLYPLTASTLSLLALRVVHGAGMGLYPTAGLAVVADLAPPARRGEAMGVFGMASNVGLVFGPLAGVLLERHLGFLALCLASAAVGAGGVGLALRVPETGRPTAPPPFRARDLIAPAALRPALITLVFFLSYGAVISFLPLLADTRGIGNAGTFFMVMALALLGVRTRAGRLSDRFGRGPVVVPAGAMMALSLTLLAGAGSDLALYGAGLLLGAGMGTAQPALMAWSADLVASRDRGKAVGTFHAAWELGIGAGSILFGLLLPLGGFTRLLLGAAALTLAGGLLALPVPARRPA
jgi:predicted MFS family arabinose efflux permease